MLLLPLLLLGAPDLSAEPVEPDEAFEIYWASGFTFPVVPEDRSAFYATYFMDHVVSAVCAADTDHDGVIDAYLPCTLRKDWNCGIWRYEDHQGTDFANGSTAGLGMAAADVGWVVHTRDGYADDAVGGYGNYAVIRHPGSDGQWSGDDFFTFYGHMEGGSILVRAGDSPETADLVYCGQRIGTVGDSGSSTATHIHFEVRSGDGVNPASSWQPSLTTDPYAATDPAPSPCTQPASSRTTSLWYAQNDYAVFTSGDVPGARPDCRVALVDDLDPGFMSLWFNPWDEVWEPGVGASGAFDAGGFGPGMAVPVAGPGVLAGGEAAGGHWRLATPYDINEFATAFRWTPAIPVTGLYEVHVYVPGVEDGASPLTAVAQYDAAFHGGHATATLDQDDCAGGWCRVIFPFGTESLKFLGGSTGYLQLTNLTGDPPSIGVAVDAARFVYVGGAGGVGPGGICFSPLDCGGEMVCGGAGECVPPCWSTGCTAPDLCEQATGLCVAPGTGMIPEDYFGDGDQDADGILDGIEGGGDFDGDGLPNYLDADSDGDGIDDMLEGADDSDDDGDPDFLDEDSDDDGIPDSVESGLPGEDGEVLPVDSDEDGEPDYVDEDSDGDGIPDADEGVVDTDEDGTADFLDEDSDDDGISDADEGGGDEDGDGLSNARDDDSDGDGIPDAEEGTSDSDGDGEPDFLDEDSDGDGVPDLEEGAGDPDGDGVPNYLDLDSDGDGVSDTEEAGLLAVTDPPGLGEWSPACGCGLDGGRRPAGPALFLFLLGPPLLLLSRRSRRCSRCRPHRPRPQPPG